MTAASVSASGSPSSPVRLGSLGVGRIVHRGLLPGVAGCPEVVLQAVASERPEAACATAAAAGCEAVEGYDALLARDDIDAVYIPCRGDQHRRWVERAAAAGKHVLCEKPLGRNVAESEAMANACRAAGVVLMEAFMWRHHPRSLRARELVRIGAIGTLRLVLVHFSFQIDLDDWRLDPAQGGGAIYDIGCYGIDAARYFTGEEPEAIDAAARLHSTGVDLSSRIGLTFPSGAMANVSCSFETPFACRCELIGSAGAVVLDDFALPPDDGAELILQPADGEPRIERSEAANQYAGELSAFAASIRDGSLVDPAENGLANARVIEAACVAAGYDVRA